VKRRCVINGRFLAQRPTGVQRYAIEVVTALDHLLAGDASIRDRWEFELISPRGIVQYPTLKAIVRREVGRLNGHLWEQLELPSAARGAWLVSLCNTGPLVVRDQIVAIHDASVFFAPAGYTPLFRLWYRCMHRRLARCAARVVTDSMFSRQELERACQLAASRSTVIPLGADHVVRREPDQSILVTHNLHNRPFVLAVGSLNPNKNISALAVTARRLEERGMVLVVAGGANARIFGQGKSAVPPSTIYLGYVTDAQLRALYESAVCLVFPSRYEGFGLPPLESMVCGCPVVVSKAASLPEVCGGAALYVNPDDSEEIADKVLSVASDQGVRLRLQSAGRIRAREFSWESTARRWLELLDRIAPGSGR
jgi:glycosyltransferase involved in cell wall biosynthesis